MGKLSNHKFREESMKRFLEKMGLSTEGIEISSIEGLFSYQLRDVEEAQTFATHLAKLIYGENAEKVKEIVDFFQSQVVATNDAEFVAAMESDNSGVLRQWAAQRELFTENLVVETAIPHPIPKNF